jgi:hypothetical protein
MSAMSQMLRRLDADAVQRAEKKAPAIYAERLRRRDRGNIRRALRRLGYHEGYVMSETNKLSAMRPHHRKAALAKLRRRLGL